jgi:hypothetical protein
MSPHEIPQDQALDLFLAMVAGNEPRTSFFEIRAKPGWTQDFIPLRERDRAARSVTNRGKLGDTYVGVAPRASREGTLAAVERVWAVHADCDGRESLERLAKFHPLASMVIRSGTTDHVHAYWPLSAAVPTEWAKRGNRRLALALGADRNATDAARIMRPPGTYNYKHDPRRPVVATRAELDVFTLGQVIGHLPDDPNYVRRPRPQPTSSRPPDVFAVLEGLARTVREAAVGNRNSVLHWAGCRLAERDLDSDDARDLLREAALTAGLPEHEIDRTVASALDTRVAA